MSEREASEAPGPGRVRTWALLALGAAAGTLALSLLARSRRAAERAAHARARHPTLPSKDEHHAG